MTSKQLTGEYAPDGSIYVTLTDGNGNNVNITTNQARKIRLAGRFAYDASQYITITDGNGNLK